MAGRWIICICPWTSGRPCFSDGSSEVTDFLISRGARRFHSSPRWKVEAVSPQSEVTPSQSLRGDNDDGDGGCQGDKVNCTVQFVVVLIVVFVVIDIVDGMSSSSSLSSSIWMFLKTVYIRNEQNVTDLHRLFYSCFIPF